MPRSTFIAPTEVQFHYVTKREYHSSAQNLYTWTRYCFGTYAGISGLRATLYINILNERHIMAKQARGFDVIFVEIRLTEDDKKAVEKWANEGSYDAADFVGAMNYNNYKVSSSYDQVHDCFIVSLTGKPDQKDNPGKCLVSRGKTWDDAVCVAAYKHIVLCKEGDWGAGDKRVEDWG